MGACDKMDIMEKKGILDFLEGEIQQKIKGLEGNLKDFQGHLERFGERGKNEEESGKAKVGVNLGGGKSQREVTGYVKRILKGKMLE